MEKRWFQKIFSRGHPPTIPSLRTRAENGEAEAQFSLGIVLACTQSETRDYAQAIHWYTKAADQHHAMAQLNLGIMYDRGQGVIRDEIQAERWLRKSAEQGDPGAQFNMGVRCQRTSMGETEPAAIESRIESYKWLSLSAAQGYNEATASWEQVTMTMSRQDVDQGNCRVAAFLASHPNKSE